MDDVLSSTDADFLDLAAAAAPLLVLTGAGISASVGIPTYRDADGRWLRSDPITHREFIDSPRQRQRYWGRSALGWPALRDAAPGVAHRSLARLEASGHVSAIVTQNVDRLHQRAGSDRVVDLHGRLDRVHCLDCAAFSSRETLQKRLLRLNPFLDRQVCGTRPDGDADLAEAEVDAVRVANCLDCGGTLMPDVVFFGGNIPTARTAASKEALAEAGGLLVVGSSLQVYSGYRFCRWAKEFGKPLLLINPGTTRADALATAKLCATAENALPAMLKMAAPPAPTKDQGSVAHG